MPHHPAGHDVHDAADLLSVVAHPPDGRGRAVVEAAGELDHYTAPLLRACLRGQTGRRGLRELVVDLRRVTFLDAGGVAVLVEARRRCLRRGITLLVRCDNQRTIVRPLELTGQAVQFCIDEDRRVIGRTGGEPRPRRPAAAPGGARRRSRRRPCR